jgi:hypothetical protein
MRVLWLEDFGGLDAGSATVTDLFAGLVSTAEIDDQWEPEWNLLRRPELLANFFEKANSRHSAHLCRHYADFAALAEERGGIEALSAWLDVVIIDVNLSRDAPEMVPSDIDVASADFQRRAGFYIYNDLTSNGFPREQICFLTGEMQSTYEEFRQHCRIALMPLPKAFEKGERGYGEFRDWLAGWKADDYVTLRRGLIDGSSELAELVEGTPAICRAPTFSDGARLAEDARQAALNQLLQMQFHLPARVRTAMRPRALLSAAAAITHEWGSRNPAALRGAMADCPERKCAIAFGCIAKTCRNWIAHHKLSQFEARDVAFVFLMNTRALFALEPNALRHEQLLLELFEPNAVLRQADMESAMSRSYADLVPEGAQHDHTRTPYNMFSKSIQYQVEHQLPHGSMRLLYQMFWFELNRRHTQSQLFVPDLRDVPFADETQFVTRLAAAISGISFH